MIKHDKVNNLKLLVLLTSTMWLAACQTTTVINPNLPSDASITFPTVKTENISDDFSPFEPDTTTTPQEFNPQVSFTPKTTEETKPIIPPTSETTNQQTNNLPKTKQPTAENTSTQINPTPPKQTTQTINLPNIFNLPNTAQQNAEKQRQAALLERARQNSNSNASTISTTVTPAAYNQLMKRGMTQLRNNQLGEAEATFTRAQRLAPKASAAYFYLGQIALKRNHPAKAEAMARRGLLVATSKDNKQGLWIVILKSAQMRENDQLIQEAKRALR